MMKRKIIAVSMAALLMVGINISAWGGQSENGIAGKNIQTGSKSVTTRIVYGTVDDVARNLVKVNQDKTEGITPRYLDLSEVEKKGAIKKGDQVKMKVNLHNIVIDYWIIEEK